MTAGRAVRAATPGLRLASVRGIDLRIDRSWTVIFVLVAWSAAAYFPRALPGLVGPGTALFLGVLASLVLFASILAHELSHSLVARALGYEVRSITLFVFGGVSEIAGEPRTARDEGAIALAGPALSLLIASVLTGATALLPETSALHALAAYLAAANFALAVFNLLPGFPLDGGRVLRAVFRATGDSLLVATRKAAFAGKLLGLAFITLGLAGIALGALLPGVWMSLIGWFLRGSADTCFRQVALRARLEELRVDQVAERLIPLDPDAPVLSEFRQRGVHVAADSPLLDAVDLMARQGLKEIAVADARGEYWGVLRLDRILTCSETNAC